MFIPVGIAAWPVLVELARRQYLSEGERREPRLLGRMPAPAIPMDGAAGDIGGPGDLGDQRALRTQPTHDDHDIRV